MFSIASKKKKKSWILGASYKTVIVCVFKLLNILCINDWNFMMYVPLVAAEGAGIGGFYSNDDDSDDDSRSQPMQSKSSAYPVQSINSMLPTPQQSLYQASGAAIVANMQDNSISQRDSNDFKVFIIFKNLYLLIILNFL